MDPADVRTLDLARQRLSQLVTALDGLRADVLRGNPLPPWESLQEKTNSVAYQFQQVASHLQKNEAFFASAHTYPLPSFPDRSHENVVGQLLRKKLEPDVEKWIDEGTALGKRVDEGGGLKGKELDDVWGWAAERAVGSSAEIPWGIDYTLDEREEGVEGVMTGIMRKLNDGMEDMDEEEEEEEDGRAKDIKKESTPEVRTIPAKPPMPLETILRFMNMGHMPPGR